MASMSRSRSTGPWSGAALSRTSTTCIFPGLHVNAGETIDIITGSNKNGTNDLTERRMKIWDDTGTPSAAGSTAANTASTSMSTVAGSTEGAAADIGATGSCGETTAGDSGSQTVFAEVGSATVGSTKTLIDLKHSFIHPVVIATITDGTLDEAATARVSNTAADPSSWPWTSPTTSKGSRPRPKSATS